MVKVILLLHYTIHFEQCTTSTGNKIASKYNAATTMLNSWCGVLGVECLTFTLPDIQLVIVAKQLNVCFNCP